MTGPMKPDIQGLLFEDAERRREMPEGVSVAVLVPHDITVTEADVREVGPLIAERLHPDTRFGRVLFIEQVAASEWEVVVEDLGPKR